MVCFGGVASARWIVTCSAAARCTNMAASASKGLLEVIAVMMIADDVEVRYLLKQ